MDIKDLKYFLQLSKDKNFSVASRNLYITQQALSKSIKKLENDLNIKLFERGNKGLELTKFGILFKEQSEPVVKHFNTFINNISNESFYFFSEISISVSSNLYNYVFKDLIFNFQKLNTKIKIGTLESDDLTSALAVLDFGVDLGITIGPVDSTRFDYTAISRCTPYLLVNKQHHLANRTSIPLEDLKHENIIISSKDSKLRQVFNDRCITLGFSPLFKYDALITASVYDFVKENKGIGISFCFDIENPPDDFILIPFEDKSFVFDIVLIHRKCFHISDAIKTFMDFVIDFNSNNNLI